MSYIEKFFYVHISKLAVVSLVPCPQKLLIANIVKINIELHQICFILAECITTYFVDPNDGKGSENDVPRGRKYVLNSKATEESLVNNIMHKFLLPSPII